MRMTIGTFASFLALQGLFMAPLESLLETVSQLQYLGNHLERLDDVLTTPVEPSGTVDPGRLVGVCTFLRDDPPRSRLVAMRHLAALGLGALIVGACSSQSDSGAASGLVDIKRAIFRS